MDEAFPVRGVEGPRHIRHPPHHDIEGGPLRHHRSERFPRDELHHEIRRAVVIAHVVNRDNVRMIELRDGARLFTHSPSCRRAARRIAFFLDEEQLDRDDPMQLRVPGSEDTPHSAGAEHPLDAVAAELCTHADHQRRSPMVTRTVGPFARKRARAVPPCARAERGASRMSRSSKIAIPASLTAFRSPAVSSMGIRRT
jgi:hypothetical protein